MSHHPQTMPASAGWKHPRDEASPCVLAVGVDSKDIRKD